MAITSTTRFIGFSDAANLEEKKTNNINSLSQPFTAEDIASFVGVGSEGPQGVEGPAGPPGPVGPAGLEWKGAWTSGTSYVADDAVGYDGASWFCILATSGTSNPSVDTTHWALLAAQGAQGIQGAQGPTGPQGPTGAGSVFKSYVAFLQFLPDGTPDDTIVYSDIVDDVTVSQAGTGVYLFSSNGKFTSNKTLITPFAYQGSTTNSGAVRLPIYSSNAIVGHYWLQRQTSSEVVMYFVDAAQAPVNPYTLLGTRKVTADIKVYN
jgi:hypothetical protein